MSSFFESTTRRIEIGDQNWVEVRQLSWGQGKQSMENSMTTDKKGNVSIDPGAIRIEQMVMAIAAWGGPGFDNRPVTRENIMALPMHVGNQIEEVVDELNQSITEDEKKA